MEEEKRHLSSVSLFQLMLEIAAVCVVSFSLVWQDQAPQSITVPSSSSQAWGPLHVPNHPEAPCTYRGHPGHDRGERVDARSWGHQKGSWLHLCSLVSCLKIAATWGVHSTFHLQPPPDCCLKNTGGGLGACSCPGWAQGHGTLCSCEAPALMRVLGAIAVPATSLPHRHMLLFVLCQNML